jgi:hypothetical protein
LAVDFVAAQAARMPNFVTRRTTTRYQDVKLATFTSVRELYTPNVFYLIDRITAVLRVRNGKDEEEQHEQQVGTPRFASKGLQTWGIFGTALSSVMHDILAAKVGWARWEPSSRGTLAVYRFSIPKDRSTYTVRYCCFWDKKLGFQKFEAIPAYHGEISIDPNTGQVLRLLVITDLESGKALFRSDLVVDYGPVEIAGQTYILPMRAVAAAGTKVTQAYYSTRVTLDEQFPQIDWYKVNSINDIAFSDFHVFRGDVRIVSDEQSLQPDSPTIQPSDLQH